MYDTIMLMWYYLVNAHEAYKILSMLSDEEIERIREEYNKEGFLKWTDSNCDHEVDIQDLYCRSCGMNFITGETPKQKYKAGYEAAKADIVRLIKGGKE